MVTISISSSFSCTVQRSPHLPPSRPVLNILFCHTNPLHVFLHDIHESSLTSSSFPPAWQLNILYLLSNMPTILLYMFPSVQPELVTPRESLGIFNSDSLTTPVPPSSNYTLQKVSFSSCCCPSFTTTPIPTHSICSNSFGNDVINLYCLRKSLDQVVDAVKRALRVKEESS